MINPNPTELVFNNEINVRETLKILDCIVLTTRTTFRENTKVIY